MADQPVSVRYLEPVKRELGGLIRVPIQLFSDLTHPDFTGDTSFTHPFDGVRSLNRDNFDLIHNSGDAIDAVDWSVQSKTIAEHSVSADNVFFDIVIQMVRDTQGSFIVIPYGSVFSLESNHLEQLIFSDPDPTNMEINRAEKLIEYDLRDPVIENIEYGVISLNGDFIIDIDLNVNVTGLSVGSFIFSGFTVPENQPSISYSETEYRDQLHIYTPDIESRYFRLGFKLSPVNIPTDPGVMIKPFSIRGPVV